MTSRQPYKPHSDTRAIIAAIETAAASAKQIAASVSTSLQEHTKLDDERFKSLTGTIEVIGVDVKSLLETRSFTRGAWKVIVTLSTIAGTIASLIVAYFRGH